MRARRRERQHGQALVIVLAFIAAFLLMVSAALWLVSGAFLDLGAVKTDTKDTYALDAGLAYAIQTNDSAAKGAGCKATNPQFTLSYGTSTITVNLAITPVVGCKVGKPSYGVVVSSPSFKRILRTQISSSNAGKKASWTVNWEAFQ